ncbi:MAG TPA: cation:proton antiporter [Tepidisphaeraceae bacterium]|jgi:CPA2 family monovalent cation:H+ antiporter-2|nr:cation:proton antiporter [Tepidisphaeraceae bacterium]
MDANPLLFRDLTYIFLAAVGGGLLAWRLRLPLILGFVIGGIVISPFTPGVHLSDLHTFEVLAEVGVVLLMFSIGVEFSISELMSVKWVALLGGSCGIALSIALAVGAAKLFGWPLMQGIVIGATISVASTMVLARLLVDRNALSTSYGRVMIGITLFEDLAVVLMTVVLPSFAGSEKGRFITAAWTIGKALILLIPLAFVTTKVIPPLLRKARDTKDPELFLLVAIAICLGTAALSHAAGFSTALGAFLAGFSISGSKDLHVAHAQLVPLRDAFVALFFVTIGALIQPRLILHSLPLLGLMLALIVPGKFIIWALVVKLFRYPMMTAIAAAAGLTQIGELSFVVVRVARESGLVGEDVFNATLAASLISIFLNVFIVRGALAWVAKKRPA